MNHFRTIVSPTPSRHKISLKNAVFTTGSCFADVIGFRLQKSKFNVSVNPFGTTYNPLSIHKGILYGLRNELPPDPSYLSRESVHLNYDFHSCFSALEKAALTESIRNAIETNHLFLKSADRILITYGTAWVYVLANSGELVNNCHKIPSGNFQKNLLTENEIVESFNSLYTETKKINPALKFILTLSPVRHLKDTLELNSVSKAVLRSACHTITKNNSDVEYFPAFEMMMDDLRDYRFYKSDMLHPTEDAESYIWENFRDSFFDQDTIDFVNEWTSFQSRLHHKPFHPQSDSHQKFLQQTLAKLIELKSKINVDSEIAAVKAQLINQS
jgi:hypothetical protein